MRRVVVVSVLAVLVSAPAQAADRTITSDALDGGYAAGRGWVDADGDGRADYCRLVGGTGQFFIQCTLSTGDGFGSTIASPYLDAAYESSRTYAEVDADRRADYCGEVGNGGGTDERVACTSSAERPLGPMFVSAPVGWGLPAGRAWADATGDGRDDYCRLVGTEDSAAPTCTPTGDRSFGATFSGAAVMPGAADSRAWVDVNGDGRADFCRLLTDRLGCALSTGDGFGGSIESAPLDPGYAGTRAWTDADGDGRADYCRFVGESGSREFVQCTLASAAGFGATFTSDNVGWGEAAGRAWADFDGDGRRDFCRPLGSAPSDQLAGCVRFAPDGAFTPFGRSEPLIWGEDTGRAWADATGDGKADFCRVTGSGFDRRAVCTISNGADFTAPPPPPPGAPPPAPTPDDPHPAPIDSTVRTFWRVGKRTTQLASLVVTGLPADGKVTIACRGRRCPYKQRTSGVRGRARLSFARPFKRRRLVRGNRIEVTVTAPGRAGKRVRYAIRRRALPKRTTHCLPAPSAPCP